MGCLVRTGLIPMDLVCSVAGLEAGAAYSALAQRNKGKDLGKAHIKIALAFFSKIPETEVLQGNTELQNCLKTFWDEVVNKCDEETLGQHIQIFKLTKPKKASKEILGGNYVRITIRMIPANTIQNHAERLEISLLEAFASHKWALKSGPAPRSANERKVGAIRGR